MLQLRRDEGTGPGRGRRTGNGDPAAGAARMLPRVRLHPGRRQGMAGAQGRIPLEIRRRARGTPPPLLISQEVFPHAQVTEQPAQDLQLGGDRSPFQGAVCCPKRQGSHFLWLQLCPVKNQTWAHGPLLPLSQRRAGMDSPRAVILRGQIHFFFRDSAQCFHSPWWR